MRRRINTRRVVWFGGVGLADAILGMGGDQTLSDAQERAKPANSEVLSEDTQLPVGLADERKES